jgi:hypothetical protein
MQRCLRLSRSSKEDSCTIHRTCKGAVTHDCLSFNTLWGGGNGRQLYIRRVSLGIKFEQGKVAVEGPISFRELLALI